MQPEIISLDVNVDNDDGTTAEVTINFTRFDKVNNRSDYIADNHTLAARNTLNLYRTTPTKSGNFLGTARTAVKFTQDFPVSGVDATTTLVVPGIVDVGFSFPVGLTPAQTLELRMRAVALLLKDTVMVPLTDQQLV